MPAALGWVVLGLVFVDEMAAAVAASVWGGHVGGWVVSWLALVAVIVVWAMFASPKAPYGGPVVRPVVKVLVFGLASLGLVAAGRPVLGAALLVFSVVVNGLAQLPSVQALVRTDD